MSPTFKEIWVSSAWLQYFIRSGYKVKHIRGYYQFRSVVRIAFWSPLVAYAYYLVMSSI